MNIVKDVYKQGDTEFQLAWIPCDTYENLDHITQVYGFCFDKKNRLLVIESQHWNSMIVPGGGPEPGETPEETLIRELDEEVNITIKDIRFLGYQNVTGDGKVRNQLRFAAKIDKLMPRKIDPCDGVIYRRYFINPKDYGKISLWHSIGDAIVQRAIEKLHLDI